MKFVLAIAFLSILPGLARAESDEIIYLPEGQVELTDVMSPEEIYNDMLDQGLVVEDSVANILDFDKVFSDNSNPNAARAKIYIYVSKRQQHLYVYEDGRLKWDWKVSTGTEKRRCPPAAPCRIARTPTGIRHPGVLHWEHYSSLYGNAPMHRAIQFAGGVYLHATYGNHIPMLGRRDSGGCVRQHPKNAERLFLLVKETIEQYGRQAVLIEITEK